jgi:hypothetical protein
MPHLEGCDGPPIVAHRGVYKHVCWLDITVDYPVVMNMCNAGT